MPLDTVTGWRDARRLTRNKINTVRVTVEVEVGHVPTLSELQRLAAKAQRALDTEAYYVRRWEASAID